MIVKHMLNLQVKKRTYLWCHFKELGQDFEKLKQMVLLEELKDKVQPDIRSHLDEQKVEERGKSSSNG